MIWRFELAVSSSDEENWKIDLQASLKKKQCKAFDYVFYIADDDETSI